MFLLFYLRVTLVGQKCMSMALPDHTPRFMTEICYQGYILKANIFGLCLSFQVHATFIHKVTANTFHIKLEY